MHAFLLIHPSANSLDSQTRNFIAAKLNLKPSQVSTHPDVHLVTPAPSLTINQVRQLQTFATRKPFQASSKAIYIQNAHLLTLPAANALLKILEEPPAHTLFVLTTPNSSLLLDTIISRCHLIMLDNPAGTTLPTTDLPHSPDIEKLLQDLPQLTPSQRLGRVGEYTANRDKAIEFCQSLQHILRHELHHSQTIPPQALAQTHLALRRLKTNLNPRLTLEQLLLNL